MNTTNLIFPLLESAQSQKHVLLNEALQMLDALLFLTVISRTLAAAPSSPADGDRYIVPAGASGAWATTSAGTIVSYRDGAWHNHQPREGWTAVVKSDNRIVRFAAGGWTDDLGQLTVTALNISTAAEAGSALPGTAPKGWLRLNVGGQSRRIPLYD